MAFCRWLATEGQSLPEVTTEVPLDGSKALRRAVVDVFDHPVIQRCQLHKIRNVADKLPEKLRGVVQRRMRDAYHADSALTAQAQLETHPGAAASLREGLAETLTVLRLRVPPTLARTMRSTNAIESMISICRDHATNVKGWRDGQMAHRDRSLTIMGRHRSSTNFGTTSSTAAGSTSLIDRRCVVDIALLLPGDSD